MPKVLIAEDEKMMLDVLTKKFVSEGFEVIQATDGEEGLKKSNELHPDAILLDIIMPKLDGLEMLKKIRHESGDWGRSVPVIILSNLNQDEKMAWAVADEKPTDYLVKADVTVGDILSKVRSVLK